MSSTASDTPAFDPEIFDDRYLVEITEWEWSLYLGVSHEATPRRYRFQGGLNFSRWFDLSGKILAPAAHRGKSMRLNLSPFGPEARFGPFDQEDVGEVCNNPAPAAKADLSATLLIPESTIPTVATCLSSTWKYVHIWPGEEDDDGARVRAFSFSNAIHENLRASVSAKPA